MKSSHALLAVTSFCLLASACADGAVSDAGEIAAAIDADGAADPAALADRTRVTLVEGVAAAENLLITVDGRLLVSGDAGIFEIRGDASAVPLVTGAGCQFAGMVEVGRVVYASCFATPSSSVFAARLGPRTRTPRFRKIADLPGIILANGLAADAHGRLYVAATLQDEILRLTPADDDPFTIAASEIWLAGSGLFTNGLKVARGTVFWTDAGAIRRAAIGRDGQPGPVETLVQEQTFFDDLIVRGHVLVVADFLGNSIAAFRDDGTPAGMTTATLVNPSAVIRAHGLPGFRPDDLLVTEKTANRVSLMTLGKRAAL